MFKYTIPSSPSFNEYLTLLRLKIQEQSVPVSDDDYMSIYEVKNDFSIIADLASGEERQKYIQDVPELFPEEHINDSPNDSPSNWKRISAFHWALSPDVYDTTDPESNAKITKLMGEMGISIDMTKLYRCDYIDFMVHRDLLVGLRITSYVYDIKTYKKQAVPDPIWTPSIDVMFYKRTRDCTWESLLDGFEVTFDSWEEQELKEIMDELENADNTDALDDTMEQDE